MEQVFEIEEKSTRPLIKLFDIFPGCTALLDTGARMAMWTKSEKLLKRFPDARLIKENVSFSGFGGEADGNLYEITLKLGKIVYSNMYIIQHLYEEIPGFFLFSASMFEGMIYTIDRENCKFILDTRDSQVMQHQKEISNDGSMVIMTQNSIDRVD